MRRSLVTLGLVWLLTLSGYGQVNSPSTRPQTPQGSSTAGDSQPAHGSANVHGTVKDAADGILPNAVVALTDSEGRTRTSRTSSDGSYTFRGLVPGTYSVAVTFTGLEQAEAVLVTLSSGQAAAANVVMKVQTQREQVTVTESVTNQVSTDPANNASALVLKKEDLDALPDSPRRPSGRPAGACGPVCRSRRQPDLYRWVHGWTPSA